MMGKQGGQTSRLLFCSVTVFVVVHVVIIFVSLVGIEVLAPLFLFSGLL